MGGKPLAPAACTDRLLAMAEIIHVHWGCHWRTHMSCEGHPKNWHSDFLHDSFTTHIITDLSCKLGLLQAQRGPSDA